VGRHGSSKLPRGCRIQFDERFASSGDTVDLGDHDLRSAGRFGDALVDKSLVVSKSAVERYEIWERFDLFEGGLDNYNEDASIY
jgi:hypothetical protein